MSKVGYFELLAQDHPEQPAPMLDKQLLANGNALFDKTVYDFDDGGAKLFSPFRTEVFDFVTISPSHRSPGEFVISLGSEGCLLYRMEGRIRERARDRRF